MKFDTKIIHQKLEKLTGTNRPLVMPIYQSVKFTADSFEELQSLFQDQEGRYVYSRVSNPTVRQLETLLAELQECDDALCVGSGVAAISTVLISLLKSGDHVVMFYESYKPSRNLVTKILKKFGVEHTLMSICDLDQLESAIQPGKTKMILFESPTNPTTRLADIPRLCEVAKKHQITTVLDNTFAGVHNHGSYPIDLYLHSLTKFANGHGDSMGGAVIGEKKMISKIREVCIDLGPVMDPNSAFLILRGMKTYSLRYQRQVENAQKVAEFLENHPKIEKVMFPGLASHPDTKLITKQLADSGSIMAVYLKAQGSKELSKLLNRLQIFQISASVGSTESLIAPIEIFYGGDLDQQAKKTAEISSNAFRLTIGVEDISDLLADLKQALS
jgi:cystathionine beta-lyase/cystathionine gamma-synthase